MELKFLNISRTDMPFDLHTHTTASDGVYSPQQLVEKALQIGLKTIAITDHDTLAGIKPALEAARIVHINVIPGVEISTKYKGKSVDILGYNIVNIEDLHNTLSQFRDQREWRALQIIDRFSEIGMPITIEDVKEFSGKGVVARPHIAKAVVKKGYVDDYQTVFDEYLADGKPCAVDKKVLSPQEGIAYIHNSGGKAVLAHPVLIGDDSLVRELLEEHDFDGIEVWHRKQNEADNQRYKKLAEEFQLAMTGGSDFHNDEHRLGDFGYKE